MPKNLFLQTPAAGDIEEIFNQGAADAAASYALPAFPGAAQPAATSAPAPAAPAAPTAPAATGRAVPTQADLVKRARELGVDEGLALSIFGIESGGNFNSKDSPKGAVGGMQVMPDTYKQMMGSYSGQRDPWNNMEAGLRYLQYGAKVLGTNDPKLIAAGYQAGFGNKDVRAGKLPTNVSDGNLTPAQYASNIAARLGLGGGQEDKTEGGRYKALTPEEAAQLEQPQQDDTEGGRFKPLTTADLDKLPASAFADLTPQQEKDGKGWWSRNLGYLGTDAKIGWNNLLSSLDGIRQSEHADLLDVMTKQYTQQQIEADPKLKKEYAERAANYARVTADIKARGEKNAELMKESRPATQEFLGTGQAEDAGWNLKTLKAIGRSVVKDPVGVVADLGVQSGPQMVAMMAAAVLARFGGGGVTGAALAGGATSGYLQFGSDYSDLRSQGMSHDEAFKTAASKAAVVGAFDALSMKSAGHALDTVMKKSGATTILDKTKDVAKKAGEIALETGKQASYGMAGEAGGSLASGRTPQPTDVIAEGLGEIAGAPFEAVTTKSGAHKAAPAQQPGAAPRVEPTMGPTPAAPQPAPAAPTGPIGRAVQNAGIGQPPAAPAAPAAPAPTQGNARVVTGDDGTQYTITTGPNGPSVTQIDPETGEITHAAPAAPNVEVDPATNETKTWAATPAEPTEPAKPADSTLKPDDEPLYQQAVDAVKAAGKPSLSLVQRQLKIGYNRAARLLEQMEQDGIVSPMANDGSRTLLQQGEKKQETAAPTEQPAAPSETQLDKVDLSAMGVDELKARSGYLSEQAKANGGWNKMLSGERRRVEAEIKRRSAAAEITPEKAPISSAPAKLTPEQLAKNKEDALYPRVLEMLQGREAIRPQDIMAATDVGYARAARALETAEAEGHVGPLREDGTREVTKQQEASSGTATNDSSAAPVGTDGTGTGEAGEQPAGTPVEQPVRPAESAPATGERDRAAGGAADERPALSKELAGAKPRYAFGNKQFDLTFESDIDRAAYIAAQKNPSKRDADYVKFVADATGMNEAQVREHGAKVRENIKGMARDAEPGVLNVPTIHGTAAAAGAAPAESTPAPADTPAPAAEKPAEKDIAAGKWFGSREKAQAFIDKKGLGESHDIVPTGKARFEVKPKAVAEVETAAHEAATSPRNDLPEPTLAQKEAGNYKKGHVNVQGLDITIENPKGSTRSGLRPDGTTWEHTMSDHYGYVKRTVGQDGEQIDVYVGPNPESNTVYVVDQLVQETGKPDEHKVMIGFDSREQAVDAYKSNFDEGWKVGPVTEMTMDQFKDWLKNGDTTKQAAEAAPKPDLSDLTEPSITRRANPGNMSDRSFVARAFTKDGDVPVQGVGATQEEALANLRADADSKKSAAPQIETKPVEVKPAANEAPTPEPTPPKKPKIDLSKNTIFTEDKVAAARARLKSKLATLNSGFDPEMVMDGMTIAGSYIEAGVRSFSEYASMMTGDFGDKIKPYLLSFWEGARNFPGLDTEGMTSVRESKRLHDNILANESSANATESAQNASESKDTTGGAEDARTAIRGSGARPLEEVAPEGVPADAEGRDAERGSAEGQQGSGEAGSGADGVGLPEARSGGSGTAGVHSPAAGEVKPRKPRAKKEKAPAATAPDLIEQANEEIKEAAESAPANIPAVDFTIDNSLELGKGSETQKYHDNLAAIRTLKQIEAENRRATPEEQRTLARYVGWGGLKNAFRVAGSADGEGVAKGWEQRVKELEELLTPAELKAARNSTTAAHYTSQSVVQAIWKAAARLGFAGGAVLEPSVGTGNFLGLMPADMRGKSNVFAVEYDSLTARIAQKLYPNADILHAGLQEVPLPRNQFALAIGNPPFGKESLYFRHNPAVNGKSIHNQFFLASLDSVAEDGLMSMVVSHNLMDALNPDARKALAEKAEFLGAIRLPDTAFKENARTEVVTDILFFRKRSDADAALALAALDQQRTGKLSASITDESRETKERYDAIRENIESWTESSTIADPAGSGEQINANGYFLKNPHMVVGKIDASGKMNARADLNVRLADPSQFEPLLNAAIASLPEGHAREDLAASSLKHYKLMATAMRLAVQRAEPGAVRQDTDGRLQMVVDIDAGERGKSVLHEIELTPDTPFNEDYTLNIDGKWQRTVDKLGEDGKPLKVNHAITGKPTNRNQKETIVYDKLSDIPEGDRWGAARVQMVRDMLPIRDLLKRQLVLESQDSTDKMMEANRAKLNEAYDAFVAKHGELHSRGVSKVALMMPDGALAMATEQTTKAKDGKVSVRKADIMSKRVTAPPKPVDRAENVHDAVALSLSEAGRIDIDRVAQLLGTDEAGAVKALSEGENPAAYYDPEESRWEPVDMYLSGLVRRKLLAAKAAGLEANVKALEGVIPKDWDSSEITPNIGSAWIPGQVYADFIKHMGYKDARVHYSPVTNSFSVDWAGEPSVQWATTGNAHRPGEIISRLLNSQSMKVTWKDDEGRTHVDEEATAQTQQKANEIFNEFLDWAYQDDARREELVRIFNDKYNTRVVRQRDGSFLNLPGKIPNEIIKMRRHQLNAIWRGITDRAVLYDHVVGAGKTFTAIARIMERRRMGLSRKPLVVVPNHLVEQWAHDAKLLYPGAKVLAAGKEDFERSNRRRLFARIGAGDYDMVIIGHSSFGFIDLDPVTEERYLNEELQGAYAAIKEAEEEAAANGQGSGWRKPFGVKEAERLVKKLEERLARLREGKKDRLLTFEEMGVDDLTIDEAHEFKNLAYSSRLTGVSGMGNKTGSGKAMDLHLKVRSLHDRPGTSTAFLTGTPISNSVAEMYLVLRNLVPNEMKEMGIDNFDAWRSMYVSYASAYEPTEAGGVKEVTRLGREWMNMKSLMDLYYSVSDAVTIDDIKTAFAEDNPGKKFPVPDVRSARSGNGDREMVAVKPTPEQREILKDIVAGFNGLDGIQDPKERNAARLRLMDRARKVSLDPRAVDPSIPVEGKGGKIAAVVDNIARIYKRWDADKGTQIVFLDRSVPKSKGDDKIVVAYDNARAALEKAIADQDEKAEQRALDTLSEFNANEVESLRNALNGGWNAYDEIKRQLVEKGIPENEIRFVQEAQNDKQKKALFDQVKSGEVRVLVGSTPRMGAGTNVQDRLVGLHHVDVTWKPSDIEQREGRIVRQGNKLLEQYGDDFAVDVIAYATEMTVDAKMWALNATKLKAINGIRKYDGSFQMEFEDAESASMAEMAALATGNPLMVERVTLTGDIQKLEMQQRSYKNRINAMRDRLKRAQRSVEGAPSRAARANAFADKLDETLKGIKERSAARTITVEGKTYTNAVEAQAAADARIDEIKDGNNNARFAIEVGGQKLTSKSAVEDSISEGFGTPDFEATLGGKTMTSLTEASKAIAEKAVADFRNAPSFTMDGITVNGIPVEIDVAPARYSDSGVKNITFSAVNDNGQSMTDYTTTLGTGMVTAGGVRAGLDRIAIQLDPSQYRAEARWIERDAADASKEVPGLEKEVQKPFPAEGDLTQKRDRLQKVIAELAATSDAARLEEGQTAEQGEKFSAGGNGVGNGAEALGRELRSGDEFGSIATSLIKGNSVVLHDTAQSLPVENAPAGVRGVTMPDGTIHLVASNIAPGAATAVLLHEAFHKGGEKLIGSKAWSELMGRLDSLYRQAKQSGGRAREFFDAARASVKEAAAAGGVAEGMTAEEFGAYIIEHYEQSPMAFMRWAEEMSGNVKAWMLRRFGKQLGSVTPAQLRALAVAALRDNKTGGPNDGARFSTVPTGTPTTAPATGLTPPAPGRFERFQATVQDNMNRVKRVQERIAKLTGTPVDEHADYYRAEGNRPGRVAARLEEAQKRLTGPLMKELAKSGYKPEQLEELLHAQHAEERNKRVALINADMPDGGSGMTTADAKSILAQYANDTELKRLADKARDIARATLDLKLEYGLVDQDTHDTLSKAYKNYVPLKGDLEPGPKVKRAMGHEARDEHILENISRDYDQAVVTGEKNLARQSLLALVSENDDPSLWTIGIPPKGRYIAGRVYNVVDVGPAAPANGRTVGSFTSQSQVNAFLEGLGSHARPNYIVLDSNGERVAEFVKPLQDNEVMVYVEGQPVRIQIHDTALAQQLRPLDQARMHPILELMRGMNRYLSKIYTGYNPAFILRNAYRDAITGTINMVGNEGAKVAAQAWTKYPAAAKALAQWAATGKAPAGKTGTMLTEYRMHGGKTGASWMSDLETTGKNLTRLYEDAYGASGYLKDKRAGKAAVVGGRKAVAGMAHVVEIANQAAENALRFGLYMAMRENGETPGRAASAAKNVTVDFDRKGSMTSALGAVYLFFNPAIQGTANGIKTLAKGAHRKQAYIALGMLGALGFLAGSMGMDDDKDRWLGTDWSIRSKNLRLHIGGHTLQVPLSQEFAPVYALGTAIAEWTRGEGAMKTAARMMSSFIDAYFPFQGAYSPDSDNHGADAVLAATPTAIKPFAQMAVNRNSFGTQIVPENEFNKDTPSNMKMNRATQGSVYDSLAQSIEKGGELVGAKRYEDDITKVSPETLKFLWSTYAGGLGQFVADSAGLGKLTLTEPGAIQSTDVPILKDFYKDDTTRAVRSRFYEVLDEAKQAQSELTLARKNADAEALKDIVTRPGERELLAVAKMGDKTNKVMKGLRDQEVRIQKDDTLTVGQKREKLKANEAQQEKFLRGSLEAMTR